MQIARWSIRIVATCSVCAAVAFCASYMANNSPHSHERVAALSAQLFEFGAVGFVHDANPYPEKSGATQLFACVRSGRTLTPAQSIKYRRAYQTYLATRQTLFRRLDANLQIRIDSQLDTPNNIGKIGLPGRHDHHDLSMLDNLQNIADALKTIETIGPIARIITANDLYKDLTDLMVHMAPAVHSVGLFWSPPLPQNLPDDLAVEAAKFITAMKAAQHSDINSPAYWQNIDRALHAYGALVEGIQTRMRRINGPALHAISGQWLSVQTIAPLLSTAPLVRRTSAPAPCMP